MKHTDFKEAYELQNEIKKVKVFKDMLIEGAEGEFKQSDSRYGFLLINLNADTLLGIINALEEILKKLKQRFKDL